MPSRRREGWRCARWAAALLLSLLAALSPANAQEQASKPDFRLDLDAGGHRSTIKDLAFTPDGELLVSASDDKTIRVWDWRSGVTLRTIRGYMGDGHDGKVFAVAVSPDGSTIAAGGYFGKGIGAEPPYGDVRLFDLATGRIKAVLPGNEYAVKSVAFAPDGAWLAAGGQDGFVYLWRRDEAAEAGWTPETRLDADSYGIEKIAFAAGGTRIAATTSDNGIRLWNVETQEEIALPEEAEPLRDTGVMALAVSSDGALFATGNADGRVQVWRAGDGALQHTLPGLGFFVGSLDFAGERLIVSCGYRCGDANRSQVWRLGEATPERSYAGHDGTVFASAPSPDGTLIATAGGTAHAIHVWNPETAEPAKTMQGAGLPVMAIGISPDGTEIAWGNENPCPELVACPERMGALAHRLALPTPDRFFVPPEALGDGAPDYRRALHSAGEWSLKAAEGGSEKLANGRLDVIHGGKVAQSIARDETNGFLHASFTLVDDGLRLITGGSDGTLIEHFSATGRIAGEFLGGHTGEIHAMAASERANLLVTGSGDQTIRLWNLTTRELIVSMFFAGGEWVAWMPQGYYYSSADGDKLIGWQVNQGRQKEGRFVRAEQLRRYLWSPEMVRRAIILRSATQAVSEMRPGVDAELVRLLERRPPEFDVRVAPDQSGVREGYVAVEITGAKEAGTDVAGFSILSNSRSIGDFAARSVVGDGETTIIEVPVEEGENAIRVTGTNAFGYLTERSVVALGRKKFERKGKLFAIVVGVEKYPLLPDACNGRSCDLRYPVDDAAEFLRVLAERTAPLYTGMETLVLLNRDSLEETPDREGEVERIVGDIENVLEPDSDTIGDEIEDFLDRPGPDDTTMLFVAGHGINIDEDYYFIPTDGRRQDGDRWRRSSLVDWADIQKALERAAGVRFLLMDTCHAGNAFNPRIEKDAEDARIVVFSATAANNTALEMAELGHGVFTYSMLAGLRGEAKTSKDGVTLFGLADYVSREIVKLTSARQKPFYYASGVDNMLLATP